MSSIAKNKDGTFKLPKSIAQLADLLYTTRQDRLALAKQVEEMQKLETAIKDYIIDNLSKDSTGVAGKVARVSIVPKVRPVVEDWDKFYAHIKKTGNFELMQRRVSDPAIKERWEDNKEVPGVTHYPYKDISLTKV